MVHKRFESFPEAFVKNLVSSQVKRWGNIHNCPWLSGMLKWKFIWQPLIGLVMLHTTLFQDAFRPKRFTGELIWLLIPFLTCKSINDLNIKMANKLYQFLLSSLQVLVLSWIFPQLVAVSWWKELPDALFCYKIICLFIINCLSVNL